MTIEVILCGRILKNGVCDKISLHSGACSSPELREYQRNATAKSRAKAKKVEDDEPECNHTNCRPPCPLADVPYPGKSELAARQQRAEAEAAEREQETARRIKRAEHERYLADILNRRDAGEAISSEDQALFLTTLISYLGLPARFTLDRDTRINRALDVESRLSEVLYGPAYEMLGAPPSKLDERKLSVRLGRFLQVADMHGSLNRAYRFHPEHKAPTVPVIPVSTEPPPFVIGRAP